MSRIFSIFHIRYSKSQKGFTLIEVLIYSAIFSLILLGMLGGVFMITQGTNRSNTRLLTDNEANFIMRKLGWATTGVTSINVPASGLTSPTLNVNKSGVALPIRFRINAENIEMDSGTTSYFPLDTVNASATSLSFQHIPASGNKPAAVKTSFYLNGILYETTKYIRK